MDYMIWKDKEDVEQGVFYRPTKTWIPNDPHNGDWQAYLTWVEYGNTADPWVPIVPDA